MSFAPARSENVICIGDRATSLRESSEVRMQRRIYRTRSHSRARARARDVEAVAKRRRSRRRRQKREFNFRAVSLPLFGREVT